MLSSSADQRADGLHLIPTLVLTPTLRRAVASGARGGAVPRWRRAELRPVDLSTRRCSEHTPRNTLLRAVRTGHPSGDAARQYAALVEAWGVAPALASLPTGPA